MSYNNPPISWTELEARLSGRSVVPDGGDGPGFSRKRDPYRAERLSPPAEVVPYAELHAHSNFSFLDGASNPEDLAEEAVRLGLSAIALTDHDGFGGTPRFAEAAQEHGMRTIHGAELTLGLTAAPAAEPDPLGQHLLVLARGVEGYHRLSHAITEANLRGAEKNRPIYDLDELVDLGREHWLILTGCRKGFRDRDSIARLISMFGHDSVAVELTNHGHPSDDASNDRLAKLATELHLPTVATGNVHAARPRDVQLAQAFAAVRARRSLSDMEGWLAPLSYLRSGAEMAHRFRRYPGAVARSVEFAEQTAFDLRRAAPQLPVQEVPEGHTPMSWLRELVRRGADKLYAHNRSFAEERLQRELAVIESKDFAGYFLIVRDIVAEARRRGILCQGRGSAANSAVCYALEITAVDSIFYNLPFERFLSASRDEEPDIDVDFDSERREEIIQWVYEKHGRRNAAQVANIITYRPRSAVRDMAKALGYSVGQQDAWSKQIDSWTHLHDSVDVPERVRDLAREAIGAPRHRGIHSGGMVLTRRPVGEVVPIEHARMSGRTVVQWDKDDCAWMGLVKFDLLGLGMLGAISKTLDLINQHTGEAWELATLPKEEAAVYDMLCLGDSVGVFQVESRAQIGALPRLKPRSFYDLVIQIALIRPGPIQGGAVHPYIRRRTGAEPIDYLHPALEPVLARTLGVPLFQEQLMQIAMTVGGCTGDDADLLRRAMGSKRGTERIERLKDKLMDGMRDHGIDDTTAQSIYVRIEAFANFGFAESHSLSFALLVYASSWLKLHYPAVFLVGLLRSQPMGFYSPQSLVADARRHGVETLRADVMFSDVEASLEGEFGVTGKAQCCEREQAEIGAFNPRESLARELGEHRRDGLHRVRLGLSGIKGIGTAAATRIVAARASRAFASLADFKRRAGLGASEVEALAQAGAFDSFGIQRREALWLAGYADSEDVLPDTSPADVAPPLPAMDESATLHADMAATGITPTRHPFVLIRERLDARGVLTVGAVLRHEHGRRAWAAGLVTHRQRPMTAGGVTFLNLEDESGMLNVVVFESVWQRHRVLLRNRAGIGVWGRVEHGDGAVNLIAEAVVEIDRLVAGAAQTVGQVHRSRDFR